jgi:hypothetical protein
MSSNRDYATIALEYVAAAAGITPKLLRDWVNDDVPGIEPAVRGGKGRGLSHRFTIPQAVGVIVAARLRNSARSCALSYVAKVVEAFAGVSGQWLEEQFAKGRTHLVTVHAGRPILEAKRYEDQVDVKAAYRAVAKVVAKELTAAQ